MSQPTSIAATKTSEPEGRAARVRSVMRDLAERQGNAVENFRALALLVADSVLETDEMTLATGHRGLQRLYARQAAKSRPTAEELEERGRALALLEVLDWTLRRVTPTAVLARLRRGSPDRGFLELLDDTPALNDATLAHQLQVDEETVLEVGARLQAAGAVRSRTLGSERVWDITPRGRDALLVRLSLRLDSRGVRRAARLILEPDRMDGPQTRRRPVTAAIVAALLVAERPLSIDELANAARHSSRRVQLGVNALLDRGILRHETAGESDCYAVRDERYCVIGIEILPGQLLGIVNDLRGERLYTDSEELADMRPEQVAGAVAELVARLRRPADGTKLPPELLGLGVELGGHIDGARGHVVLSGNIRADGKPWRDVPLARLLEQRTGLRTVVENDVDALAIHQQLYGRLGADAEEFGVLIVGEGVGSAFVARGEVLHGAHGLTGEIGHVVIHPGGRACSCGRQGCIEAYAGVPNILEACSDGGRDVPTTLEQAAELVAQGDESAQAAFRDAGEALGRGVAIIENLLNPREILIAVPRALSQQDGRSPAAQLFAGTLLETASAHAFPSAKCDIRIRYEPQLAEYGALGASSALLRRFVELPLQWRTVETTPEDAETTTGRAAPSNVRVAQPAIWPDSEAGDGGAVAELVEAVDDALIEVMG